MKAAIYARVSTSDQNCELQLTELRRYCAARDWTVTGEFVDNAVSGAKASRPQRNRLLVAARARKVDVIVTWKLDRWGRSLPDLVNTIRDLDSAGVRFIAITQNIDTDQNNPMARFMFNILGAFAEFERDLITERVISGVRKYQSDFEAGRAKSRSGRNLPPGRQKVVFRVDEALRLRCEGVSWRKIAKVLGVPQATIRLRCAENPCTETAKPDGKQAA